MTDGVGQDDEIFARIERLSGPEQLAAKARRQHAGTRAGGAVQDQARARRTGSPMVR